GYGGSSSVIGQRYASSGAPVGGTFQANTSTGLEYRAQVSSSATGDFVVVWEGVSGVGGPGLDIFGQRYSSSGAPAGGEFRVNTSTTYNQGYPTVAWTSGGSFVVTWESRDQDGTYKSVYAQRYSSTGARLGGEVRVNTYTTDSQTHPRVASDASG